MLILGKGFVSLNATWALRSKLRQHPIDYRQYVGIAVSALIQLARSLLWDPDLHACAYFLGGYVSGSKNRPFLMLRDLSVDGR